MRDPRSKGVHAFMQLLRAFLPQVLLIENVLGFAEGEASAIRVIQSALTKVNDDFGTNYMMKYRVLDAADYGVPQHRRRAIMIASRTGQAFEWPKPTHLDCPVRAWDALVNLSNGSPLLGLRGKWAALLPSIPEGKNYQWHTKGGGGRSLFGFRTRFWSFLLKLAKDQPSWTLPAQPGPATGPFHWENRRLTIEEMLRLQSFSMGWKVCGSYQQQARQVGNATPPLLAEVIGRAIGEQIFGFDYRAGPLLGIERQREIPPPEPTSNVPRKYRVFEGNHPPHPGIGKGPQPKKAA
jgi:DNA (cytosine-5)-methyltransferase 1